MTTTVVGQALLIAVESDRAAEVFEEAARHLYGLAEMEKQHNYMRAAQTLRDQAEAVRASA